MGPAPATAPAPAEATPTLPADVPALQHLLGLQEGAPAGLARLLGLKDASSPVAPPAGLADLLDRVLPAGLPELPLPQPAATEPLLAALATYSEVLAVPSPGADALRPSVRALGLDAAQEGAVAQLLLAYAQAVTLQREAGAALSPAEAGLLGSDPAAVTAWLLEDSSRDLASLQQEQARLAATKLDQRKVLQASDLLVRASDVARHALATAARPTGPAAATGWDLARSLVAMLGAPQASLRVPASLAQAMGDLEAAYGLPPSDPLPPLPAGLDAGLALLAQAQADGMKADPATRAALLLEAARQATPLLQAWAQRPTWPAPDQAPTDAPDETVEAPQAVLPSQPRSGPVVYPHWPLDGVVAAARDDDRDGYPNGLEAAVGSNPHNRTSTPLNDLYIEQPRCPVANVTCVPLLIVGGTQRTTYNRSAVLHVDLGGDDRYAAVVAGDIAVGGVHAGSLSLDVGGNDTYLPSLLGTQGAAISGEAALLIDAAGDDRYNQTLGPGQGRAQGGVGVLLDLEGNDRYQGGNRTQGYAELGAAALLDLAGNDTYSFATQGFSRGGLGLFADAAGRDAYHAAKAGGTVAADASALRPGRAFDAQGHANVTTGYGAGVFVDAARDLDLYLAATPAGGSVDLSAIKNDVGLRTSRADAGNGFGLFSDNATALLADGDGDGSSDLAELLAGTDPRDPADDPGSLAHGDPGTDGGGPILHLPAPGRALTDLLPDPLRLTATPLPINGVRLPGLLIGGSGDSTHAEPLAFLVDLGGDDHYTAPHAGGSFLGAAEGWALARAAQDAVNKATNNRLSNIPPAPGPVLPGSSSVTLLLDVAGNDTYAPDPAGCTQDVAYPLNAPGGLQFQACASLGGALSGIALLEDVGGHNTFTTQLVNRARLTASDAGLQPALHLASYGTTQGAALAGAVGILATWGASNDFTLDASDHVQLNATEATLSASSFGVAQGASLGGVGILANFDGGADTYGVATRAQACLGLVRDASGACLGKATTRDMAQGYAQDGVGVLYDGGGANRFTAPHGFAQASGSPILGESGSPFSDVNQNLTKFANDDLALLWSSAGDDTYVGGVLSQAGNGGTLMALYSTTQDRLPNNPNGDPTSLLVDLGGNDRYTLVRGDLPSAFGCPGCAFSQGAGGNLDKPAHASAPLAGRGRGILLDLQGDDRYEATGSQFVQGASYVGGTGMLLDLGGNDLYRADSRAQGYSDGAAASLVPAGQGALADLQGEDAYVLLAPDASGQGFGKGATFLDARGHDVYTDPGALPEEPHADGRAWNSQNSQDLGVPEKGDAVVKVELTVRDDGGALLSPGSRAARTLALQAKVTAPQGVTVQRVDFLANGIVLGQGQPVDAATYTLTWDTFPASAPWAAPFPDGAYEVEASVFFAPGASVPLDLESAQSLLLPLALDNAPRLASTLETPAVASGSQNMTLRVGVSRDLPAASGADAFLTVTGQRDGGEAVQFLANRSLMASNTTLSIDPRACGGAAGLCPDGLYRLHVGVRDNAGAQAWDNRSSVLLDASAPLSAITSFPQGVAGLDSQVGNGLRVRSVAGDGSGSGLALVALLAVEGGSARLVDAAFEPAATPVFQVPRVGDGETLALVTVAVDRLGNEESRCLPGEARVPVPGLANVPGLRGLPGLCHQRKAAVAGNVATVFADFRLPVVGKVAVAPLVAGTADTVNVRVPIAAPYPAHPVAGALNAWVQFGAGPLLPMTPHANGTYSYADAPLGSALARGHAEGPFTGTIVAVDGAGNQNRIPFLGAMDGLAPRVEGRVLHYADGQGTRFPLGRAGVHAQLQATALDLPGNVKSLTGASAALGSVVFTQDPNAEELWSAGLDLPATGLADGTYPLVLTATDGAGNVNATAHIDLRIDSAPPALLDVTAAARHDGFVVHWRTATPATSQVLYGRSALLGSATRENRALTLEHTVEVTGLSFHTTYFFQAVSRSGSGVANQTQSALTATTLDTYTLAGPAIAAGEAWRGVHTAPFRLTVVPGTGAAPVHVRLSLVDHDRLSSPVALPNEADLGDGETALIPIDTRDFSDGLYDLVAAADRVGEAASIPIGTLRIDNNAPILTPLAPIPSSTVTRPFVTLQLTAMDPLGEPLSPASVQVRLDGAPAEALACPQPLGAACGIYFTDPAAPVLNITLPGVLSEGLHTVNVSILDSAGNLGAAEWGFRVDMSGPVPTGVRVAYVPGPVAGQRGGKAQVAAVLADASKVASARLDLAPLGGTRVQLLSMGGGHWNATFKVPAKAPEGTTALTLDATDGLGNTVATPFTVRIDATPPTLTSLEATATDATHAIVRVRSNEPTLLEVLAPGQPPASDGFLATNHTVRVAGLRPNLPVLLNVVARDGAGLLANRTFAVSTRSDLQSPSAVGALRAASPSEGVVALAWSAASDDSGIDHYRITRLGDAGVQHVADVPGNATQATDGAAPAGQMAIYRVQAVDLGGNPGPEAAAAPVAVLALPHLRNATVTPDRGDTETPFLVTVEYVHAGGVPPAAISVRLGGAGFTMLPRSSEPCQATCLYEATVRLPATSLVQATPLSIHAAADGRTLDLPVAAPLVMLGRDAPAHLVSKASPAPALAALLALALVAALLRRRAA
ncbi:MAG TPA: hypothetical protein VM241_00285 [Candidatus Thermoplasmatota archaeon]|nr:hypothetical protein [Candidatus Thermoplasmatota archaeon]